jgi:hypothetical protein
MGSACTARVASASPKAIHPIQNENWTLRRDAPNLQTRSAGPRIRKEQTMQQQVHRPAQPHAGLFARIDTWLEQRHRRAEEAWLATSQTAEEVEARIRDMNRGAARPF